MRRCGPFHRGAGQSEDASDGETVTGMPSAPGAPTKCRVSFKEGGPVAPEASQEKESVSRDLQLEGKETVGKQVQRGRKRAAVQHRRAESACPDGGARTGVLHRLRLAPRGLSERPAFRLGSAAAAPSLPTTRCAPGGAPVSRTCSQEA